MTKKESLERFQEGLLHEIEIGNLAKIENFCLGALKIELLNVNTPLELKRFAHAFKQCDLESMTQTCYMLNKAGFIKDVRYRWLKELSFLNNIKCYYFIQVIRVKARYYKYFGTGEV